VRQEPTAAAAAAVCRSGRCADAAVLLPLSLPSVAQMMFFLNLWAIALVLLLLVVTGQLWTGIAFFRCRHPAHSHACCLCCAPASHSACLAAAVAAGGAAYPEVLPEVAVFSLLSALGQAAILVTVLNFNSLVLTTITTSDAAPTMAMTAEEQKAELQTD
jgi:hypothetical protein